MAKQVVYGPESARKCTKCGQVFPATTEHFHRHMGGLRPDCKQCRKERAAQRYLENRDAYLARNRAWRDANPEKVRDQWKRWTAEHRERRRASHNRWRRENLDKAAQYARDWRKRHRDTANAADRAYRAKTRSIRREQAARLRSTSRERYRAYDMVRRARKLAAGGTFSANDIKAIYAKQCGCCRWCSIALNGRYDVDHVVPLKRGGTNDASNLAVTCGACNRQKSSRLVFTEWTPPNPLDMAA